MKRPTLFLVAGMLLPSGVAAQDATIDAMVKELAAEIIGHRHHIHENPELGNREFETAALVAFHLESLGIEVQTGVAHTGVVGILRGGRPGPVIAVRADMDALPVTEDTPFPFRSIVRTEYLEQEVGVSHTCGHDIHTSVQMGVASILAPMRDEIPGTIKFIFQPAEEGPPPGEEGGAVLMMAEGVMTNPQPEAVFGLHVLAEMAVGKVGYTLGPALAAVDHFRIEIKGKQAHGAHPEESVDPVVMASQVIMALQTIRSRNLHPLQPSVVTVGIVRGGTRFNIIPAEVHLEGTVRTYDPDVLDTVERRMGEILDGITRAGGGTFELDYRAHHAGHHQQHSAHRADGADPTACVRRRERDRAPARDGRRGLRLLCQRSPRVLLPFGHGGAGHHFGRAPYPDLPGRRRLGDPRHAGHGHVAHRLHGSVGG